MKLTCTIYVYKKKDENNNNIFSDSNNNHRRYLQKRSTLLQNNDDCLNIAIKTLIGQIGELIRFAFFFLTNRIIIKIIIKSFTIYFFHPTVAPVSMPLLRNFLNNT